MMSSSQHTVLFQKTADVRYGFRGKPAGDPFPGGGILVNHVDQRADQGEFAVRTGGKIRQNGSSLLQTAAGFDKILRITESIGRFMEKSFLCSKGKIYFSHVADEDPVIFPVGTEHF